MSSYGNQRSQMDSLFLDNHPGNRTVQRVNFKEMTLKVTWLDHFPQRQQNQPVPLNIARYRKAVSATLWVQMTLVVSYLPFLITEALTPDRGMPLSLYLGREFTGTLVLLNSSLNPLLYCWKIREVRQTVKETLRRIFSLPCF